ncbi:DMT family transporter [Desulfosporosinus sp. PR]|uniref:DMT family transporter n=1 Tax=Candidatus Desulfosporosinus nitrosoreducens TaxID=3401928 RepID=UPI0028001999|nr:DMT family transporter [Desulfosporosinus sp. PR]MDQ7094646.1 DMT family transporter [Desulfosporosinus sp. PR]
MQAGIIRYGSLILGVFALSTSAIFVKLAAAPASITAFYRLFFAVLILLPLLFFHKENRQALCSLSKQEWGLGLLSGLFLAIHYVLWFESLNYTSVASSTVIVTLQPLFSFAGGHFLFKERVGKGVIASSLVAMAGCVIIGWGDVQINDQALGGDFLAFIAAGIITAYFFIGQHMRKQLPVVPYSILGYTGGAFFLAIYALSQQVSFTVYPLQTWKDFIGLALIATILGQMVFNWLLKWLSATVISMSILGEIIGTCLLAYFILGEVISWRQGVGIALTLAGLALFSVHKNRTSENKAHTGQSDCSA